MSDCKTCNIDDITIPQTGIACGIVDENPLNQIGNCSVDSDGNPIVTSTATVTNGGSCVTLPTGQLCPATEVCSPWDLTLGPEACLISNLVSESIEISGAPINVYKLLGVHEQGSLQDLTGAGTAISSGDMPNFSAQNAFDKFNTEWRSIHTGPDVLKHAFIGYDFGPIKLNNGRNRYGIETAIKHDIAMFKIKQGCDAINRVTKVRLERSADGEKWYGVSILQLPDCDGIVNISFNRSVPSRFWRIRPIQFNGGNHDFWAIKAFQLIDYEATHVSNIQDRIFMENRDRDYKKTPDKIKGIYTPIDVIGNQTTFGWFQQDDKYVIEFSFTKTIQVLGRPFIVGDIIEIPSEIRYRPDLSASLKYLEIENVDWSATSYTPSWVPTLLKVIAVPAIASQETQDLFGPIVPNLDDTGLSNIDDGTNKVYQDYSAISQTIKADANTMVPEGGSDFADVAKFSDELLAYSKQHGFNVQKFDRKPGVHGQDAMPPNGLPYTQGEEWPKSPKNGDYHRLTYDSVQKNIPPRLFRWSSKKNQWIYLETDARYVMRHSKEFLDEFKNPENSSVTPIDKLFKN